MARSGSIRSLRQLNTVPLELVKIKYPHFTCENCKKRFAVKSRRQSGKNCSKKCRTTVRIKSRRDTKYDSYINFEDFELRINEVSDRQCLSCGVDFKSSHTHNRTCPRCKHLNRSTSRFLVEVSSPEVLVW